jgi:holin-like protein
MQQTIKALGQLLLLWAIYAGCSWMTKALDLPIPGNVLGVVALFLLLLSGVLKLQHVQDAADFLLKHLVFFFVPVAVGLMDFGQVFVDHGLVLLGAIAVSAVAPLLAVGLVSQALERRRG